MELKLGLSPSHHFGKAKVHEEAEEKTTHNKCGCEAQVHVLQLAFHIMEPHTIKWGFLPNIPGPLPGFDFLGIIIEHHNESPFVLAVNKALTWRRLEGHSGGSHLQNDLVDLTAAATRAQQLRLFCLARSSTSSNTHNSTHEEDRGTSSSIVPDKHSGCLLIQVPFLGRPVINLSAWPHYLTNPDCFHGPTDHAHTCLFDNHYQHAPQNAHMHLRLLLSLPTSSLLLEPGLPSIFPLQHDQYFSNLLLFYQLSNLQSS